MGTTMKNIINAAAKELSNSNGRFVYDQDSNLLSCTRINGGRAIVKKICDETFLYIEAETPQASIQGQFKMDADAVEQLRSQLGCKHTGSGSSKPVKFDTLYTKMRIAHHFTETGKKDEFGNQYEVKRRDVQRITGGKGYCQLRVIHTGYSSTGMLLQITVPQNKEIICTLRVNFCC